MKFSIPSLIMALLLTSCTLIHEGEPPCPDNPDENITISFDLQTSGALLNTRVDNNGHDEVDSELLNLEDGIDMSDCALFIFAKIEGTENEEALLYKNTNLGGSTNPEIFIAGAPGAYTVNLVIAKTKLNELLNFELKPDGTERINFRILMLANCSSTGTNAQAKWNAITGQTYTAVINQLSDWSYAMANIYNENYAGDDAAGRYSNLKKNLPMFGTVVESATQESLFYSRPDNRVYLGEIYLLRSVAKVRVVDNILNKDISGFPKIVDAEFWGSQSMAKQLPYNAAGYQNGMQVHDPNIVEPDKPLQLEGAMKYKLGTIPANAVVGADFKGDVRIGFVPEQKIDNINGDVNQGMPIFHISIAMGQNADGSLEIKEFDVPMTGYKDITFGFGNSILRNHIYTLSVNEVALGSEVNLTFTVAPWIESTYSLDYTQSVTVAKPLEWRSGYEESDDTGQAADAKGEVVIKPWTINPDSGVPEWVPLTGRFGLSTPKGATWSAHLIPMEGAPNSFAFLINGELHTTVVGTIDGTTLSDIVIVTLDNEPATLNSAKLQIVVTIPGNSTVIEAPVVPAEVSYKNYTIVQNPINIQ